MATAQTIINGALRSLQVLSSGQSPTANETADALEALNQMLESWSLESLYVYHWPQESFALNGSQSYTIGSGGDFNTTRPTTIRNAFIRSGTTDYPLHIIQDRGGYDRITEKAITSIPEMLYYEADYPLGKIHLYPVGDATNTLFITTQLQPLKSFASETDTVDLPPGYERALKFNLAVDIAPEFEASITTEIASGAMKSMAAIKRMNSKAPVMRYDRSIPGNGGRYNIE